MPHVAGAPGKTSTWGRTKFKEISTQQERAAARKGTIERYFNRKKNSTGSKTRKVPMEALQGQSLVLSPRGRAVTTLEGTSLAALKVAKAQAL